MARPSDFLNKPTETGNGRVVFYQTLLTPAGTAQLPHPSPLKQAATAQPLRSTVPAQTAASQLPQQDTQPHSHNPRSPHAATITAPQGLAQDTLCSIRAGTASSRRATHQPQNHISPRPTHHRRRVASLVWSVIGCGRAAAEPLIVGACLRAAVVRLRDQPHTNAKPPYDAPPPRTVKPAARAVTHQRRGQASSAMPAWRRYANVASYHCGRRVGSAESPGGTKMTMPWRARVSNTR